VRLCAAAAHHVHERLRRPREFPRPSTPLCSSPATIHCRKHAQVPAPNYHYHCHLRCEYNDSTATSSTPHSPLVGVMLDGRGLYGMYENGLTMPSNLDACGGHVGPVPATTIGGVTYPAASNVYHYHMQHQAPYVPACYGPVTSLAQAHGLYSTCSSGTPISVCTSSGQYNNYRLDCPPVRMGSDSINQVRACGGGGDGGGGYEVWVNRPWACHS